MSSYKVHFGTYLKTEDLAGRAHRVVIDHVALEDVGSEGKKEQKLVAHFVGKPKALVLNRTKCEALEALTGTDDVEQWKGAMIVLRPGRTKFGGKVVGCIDVVAAPGTATQAPAQAPRALPRPQPAPLDIDPPETEPGETEPTFDGDAENLDDIPF